MKIQTKHIYDRNRSCLAATFPSIVALAFLASMGIGIGVRIGIGVAVAVAVAVLAEGNGNGSGGFGTAQCGTG